MDTVDVAIVGAGPAGLAAAQAAAGEGCRVVVFDDQDTPGGQYFRQPAEPLTPRGRDRFGSQPARALELIAALHAPGVDYRAGTTVWNVPETGVLAWASATGSGRLRAASTVLATGAHDRCVPFPGWTLPGVLTAGGAQNLLKGQRLLPGRRVVVAGNGPLLLAVAASLSRAGAEVACVAEAAPVAARVAGALPGLLATPGVLATAAGYRRRLAVARVPVLRGHTVVEACGERMLEAVVLAPIDPDGVLNLRRSRTLRADALVTGFGLVCSSELAALAGCERFYAAAAGGWNPRRDDWLQTLLPGVFVAGDGAIIGGAANALAEGALAGLGAARHALAQPDAHAASRRFRLRRELTRRRVFRGALQRVYAPPGSYAALQRPDTLVCRCEDVTRAEIDAVLSAHPGAGLAEVKSCTRAGMGRCQGRNCLTTLAEMAAAARGVLAGEVRWPQPRPPARPVSIDALLAELLPAPVLPEDAHRPRQR